MNSNKVVGIIGLLALALGIIFFINTNEATDKKITSLEQPYNEPTEPVLSEEKPVTKTKAQEILDGTRDAKELLKGTYEEIRDEKLRKDSIRKANRKSRWVYQIGLATDDSKNLLAIYNQLKSISNIKVFRAGRKSYFLYKDDGYTEQQLKDSLSSFQAQISGTGSKVEIIDLMSLCTLKEDIVRGDDIKVRKADVVLLCNTCD